MLNFNKLLDPNRLVQSNNEKLPHNSEELFNCICLLSKPKHLLPFLEFAQSEGFKVNFHDPQSKVSIKGDISALDILREEGIFYAPTLAAKESQGGVIIIGGLAHGPELANRFDYFYKSLKINRQILVFSKNAKNTPNTVPTFK